MPGAGKDPMGRLRTGRPIAATMPRTRRKCARRLISLPTASAGGPSPWPLARPFAYRNDDGDRMAAPGLFHPYQHVRWHWLLWYRRGNLLAVPLFKLFVTNGRGEHRANSNGIYSLYRFCVSLFSSPRCSPSQSGRSEVISTTASNGPSAKGSRASHSFRLSGSRSYFRQIVQRTIPEPHGQLRLAPRLAPTRNTTGTRVVRTLRSHSDL